MNWKFDLGDRVMYTHAGEFYGMTGIVVARYEDSENVYRVNFGDNITVNCAERFLCEV